MGKKKLIFMIAYCFTYIIYGSSFSCLGPLLAFYADASRLPEEEFALMITMRGLGYIIGGFIKLKFLKDLSLHKGMMFGCISAAIGTFLLSSTLNSYLLILYSLWFAISLLFIDVFINICFITIGGDNVKTYINIAFIFNSVGNFAGPTLVSLLGIQTMIVLSAFYLGMSIVYGVFPPLNQRKGEEETDKKKQAQNKHKQKEEEKDENMVSGEILNKKQMKDFQRKQNLVFDHKRRKKMSEQILNDEKQNENDGSSNNNKDEKVIQGNAIDEKITNENELNKDELDENAMSKKALHQKQDKQAEVEQIEQNKNKIISKKIQLLFCVEFLFYAGYISIFINWMPTFSMLLNIQTKEQAALLISMMAVIQTPVRILFIFIKTNTMNVLHISILGYLSLPIVAYILYFLHFRIFLVYEITIHFSLAFVLYLQYLYSLPQLYKMTLTTQNTSKMMTAYAVGEALLPAVIEYLMEQIHPTMMIFSMLCIGIVMRIVFSLLIKNFKKEAEGQSADNALEQKKQEKEQDKIQQENEDNTEESKKPQKLAQSQVNNQSKDVLRQQCQAVQ